MNTICFHAMRGAGSGEVLYAEKKKSSRRKKERKKKPASALAAGAGANNPDPCLSRAADLQLSEVPISPLAGDRNLASAAESWTTQYLHVELTADWDQAAFYMDRRADEAPSPQIQGHLVTTPGFLDGSHKCRHLSSSSLNSGRNMFPNFAMVLTRRPSGYSHTGSAPGQPPV